MDRKRISVLPSILVAVVLSFVSVNSPQAQRVIAPGDGPGGDLPRGIVLTPQQLVGQSIFYDASLSTPQGQSCASCHDAAVGWVNPGSVKNPYNLPTSEGAVHDRFGRRNTPTVAYAHFTPPFFYDALTRGYVGGRYRDGRAHDPLAQTKATLLNRLEMNNPNVKSVVRAVHQSSYAARFEALFGQDVWNNDEAAFELIARCLADFQSSFLMNRFNSRFDRYQAGDKLALTPTEVAGLAVFETRGTCSSCHFNQVSPDGTRPLLTNFRYYNLGVPKNPRNPFYDMPPAFNPEGHDYVDLGLGGVLNAAQENGKFKVPSLRNVSLTPPYMHNGAFTTLSDVVMFMNTRDVDTRWGPPEVAANVATGPLTGIHVEAGYGRTMPGDPGDGPPREGAGTIGNLKLTGAEIDQLVAFLGALSDGPVVAGQ